MKLSTAFAMGTAALKANALGGGTPLNVMLAVTNRCDQRCRYCQIPARQQPEMTTTQVLGLLEEMKAAGTVRLGIWGGEPLVRPDIGDIVRAARDLGFWISMDTNGTLVPKKLDVVKNLDHLVISLDGPRELHDTNRQEGSFDHAMAALEATHGVVSVWTLSVFTRHNLSAVDYLLENAQRFKAMAAFQFLHHNETMGGSTDSMRASDAEYRDVVRRLLVLKRQGAPIASSTRYLRYLLHWPDYGVPKSAAPRGGVHCWAGRLYCNVDADGAVYPCSLLIGERPSRNAVETGFLPAFRFAGAHVDCRSCDAACFTEYNCLYDLDPGVMWDWVSAIWLTGRRRARTR
ncbi:radical SAM protein [Candidatus Fermentibacteria bacterium]|nr:radical SAM protein [Candidatus Fermentibacteria bacterium]